MLYFHCDVTPKIHKKYEPIQFTVSFFGHIFTEVDAVCWGRIHEHLFI